MQISRSIIAAGVGIATVTALGALAACSGAAKPSGPMGDLTNDLMTALHGDGYRGQQLTLASDSVREVRRDDGSLQGTYDGTRLLKAADTHAYGDPVITDAKDVKGDGIATFNEVRQVVRSFDTDNSNRFDADEQKSFESTVGVLWTPGVVAP